MVLLLSSIALLMPIPVLWKHAKRQLLCMVGKCKAKHVSPLHVTNYSLNLKLSSTTQEVERPVEAETHQAAPVASASLWSFNCRCHSNRSYWTLTDFSFSPMSRGHFKSALMLGVCLPTQNPLVTCAFLRSHYWMNSETRLAVNGQFGYTAMRLELLRVMYCLSTCQLYKGGSRLCKCVCK